MKKIYSIFALSLMLLCMNVTISAQDEVITIASWDFKSNKVEGIEQNTNIVKYGPNALAPTTFATGLTVGALTRSEAVETPTAGYTGSELSRPVWGWRNLSSTNLENYPKGDMQSRYDDMISDEKYITFSLTPNTGTTLSITGIDTLKATASGSTVRMRMEYKVGDGEFTVFGIRAGDSTNDLPLSSSSTGIKSKKVDFSEVVDLQNIAAGTTITFRVIFIANETSITSAVTSGWGGFFDTDFTIKGIVTISTTSIENVSTDRGAIISEVYYNLAGKQVSADTKGLVLKKITYENGSVETVKQNYTN